MLLLATLLTGGLAVTLLLPMLKQHYLDSGRNSTLEASDQLALIQQSGRFAEFYPPQMQTVSYEQPHDRQPDAVYPDRDAIPPFPSAGPDRIRWESDSSSARSDQFQSRVIEQPDSDPPRTSQTTVQFFSAGSTSGKSRENAPTEEASTEIATSRSERGRSQRQSDRNPFAIESQPAAELKERASNAETESDYSEFDVITATEMPEPLSAEAPFTAQAEVVMDGPNAPADNQPNAELQEARSSKTDAAILPDLRIAEASSVAPEIQQPDIPGIPAATRTKETSPTRQDLRVVNKHEGPEFIQRNSRLPALATPVAPAAPQPATIVPESLPTGSVYAPITVTIDGSILAQQFRQFEDRLDRVLESSEASRKKNTDRQVRRKAEKHAQRNVPQSPAGPDITALENEIRELTQSVRTLQEQTDARLRQITSQADRASVAGQILESYRLALERSQYETRLAEALRKTTDDTSGFVRLRNEQPQTFASQDEEPTRNDPVREDTAAIPKKTVNKRSSVVAPENPVHPDAKEEPIDVAVPLPLDSGVSTGVRKPDAAEIPSADPERNPTQRSAIRPVDPFPPEVVPAPPLAEPTPPRAEPTRHENPKPQKKDQTASEANNATTPLILSEDNPPKRIRTNTASKASSDDVLIIEIEDQNPVQSPPETNGSGKAGRNTPQASHEKPDQASRWESVESTSVAHAASREKPRELVEPVAFEHVYRFKLDSTESTRKVVPQGKVCPVCGKVHPPNQHHTHAPRTTPGPYREPVFRVAKTAARGSNRHVKRTATAEASPQSARNSRPPANGNRSASSTNGFIHRLSSAVRNWDNPLIE